MKIWIWVKLSGNFDLGQHFRKISILVKILGNLDLGQNFPKILVLVKIELNVDFSQIFKRLWFWSNFYKKLNLGEIFRNIDFGWNCRKNFGKKIGQNFRKLSILVKIVENCRLWSKLTKMLILVKIDENFWCQNFRKMSTWVETYQIVDFGQHWRKCWF